MGVPLSSHFNCKKIFKITIAPIFMMIFTSLYWIVDGYFISNYAGEDAFAGVNLIMPLLMIIGGIGFMFGTGGSALTAKYLGEENREEANKVFTMMFKVTVIAGTVISVGGFFLIKPVAEAMGRITEGTTEGMVDMAVTYGRILVLAQVGYMLQTFFQSFFMVDEKPKLGFITTVIAGVINMIFDALFIAVFDWGVAGAAAATITGYVVATLIPLVYFTTHKNDNITLIKTKLNLKHILKSCGNGSSEFVNNVSSSLVGLVFNIRLLEYYGQNGVSAYGTIMYVCFIFIAIFVGYSVGMAPVVSYNFGAQNYGEQKNILKKSLVIIGVTSVVMVVLGIVSAPVLAELYCGGNKELAELTVRAMRIFSISNLFCGFSIYMSSFFTALNNGKVSAVISFLRTLVFQLTMAFLFPIIFGGEGIWWAMVAAEFLAVILSFIFLMINRKNYRY